MTIKKEKTEIKKVTKPAVKKTTVKSAAVKKPVKAGKVAEKKAPKIISPKHKTVAKKKEVPVSAAVEDNLHLGKPAVVHHKPVSIPEKPAVVHHKPAPVPEKPAVVHHKPAPILEKPAVVPVAEKPVSVPVAAVVKPVSVVPETSVKAEVKIEPQLKELELKLPITLKDLAVKMQEKPSSIIKVLMDKRIMANINQVLDETMVESICAKFGFKIKKAPGDEELALMTHEEVDKPESLLPRSPIVTFMGHVDHGKTSLLDAIRKTKIADSEHGGITQHIGAYRAHLAHGDITFLDTPGHEAFTAMRARGASITDIVVLVIAADDGVMPQTKEALDHARAAGVEIIVALNKIDKPQANTDRVKKQLNELGLMAEDWGGKTITVPVSAKTGQGIDQLMEMILLAAQMLELKANPNKPGKGVVVESRLSKGKGPVATLLVQNGTLRFNDSIIVGQYYGKIRAMLNARGQAVREAGPAVPVEVLGLSGVPEAGEQFFAVGDEKIAKDLAQKRQEILRQQDMKSIKRISLEDLHAQIKEGKLKELKLIVKSDVQGSLEAIKDILTKLDTSEIKMSIIHDGVGSINSSDVILAVASNALILGFNVEPDDPAKALISKEGVDVKTYNIIYELENDIRAALEGMLEPKTKKNFLGKVEVRKVFKLSRSGVVAGCFVSKGKIVRTAPISLIRNGEVVFEGHLSGLKRFKDDVREVLEGFECGITIQAFDALQEGDVIEAYEIQKIARKLD